MIFAKSLDQISPPRQILAEGQRSDRMGAYRLVGANGGGMAIGLVPQADSIE